jgi:hypothetical protein
MTIEISIAECSEFEIVVVFGRWFKHDRDFYAVSLCRVATAMDSLMIVSKSSLGTPALSNPHAGG